MRYWVTGMLQQAADRGRGSYGKWSAIADARLGVHVSQQCKPIPVLHEQLAPNDCISRCQVTPLKFAIDVKLGFMNLPPITGTLNVTLDPVRIAPAGPPHTYLGMARLLLSGVDPLAEAGSGCAIPLAFVSAQVAECALKASLSKGGNDRRLREKAVRHNLKALWQLAQSEGLPIPATPPNWLEILSQLHDTPYYIRYSTGVHGLMTPAAAELQSGLRDLVEIAERYVRS